MRVYFEGSNLYLQGFAMNCTCLCIQTTRGSEEFGGSVKKL